MPPEISAMLVSAGEFLRVGRRLRMRRAIRVALERDGRHVDRGRLRKPLLEIVVFRLALGQTETPSVIVDHDVDVIGIFEGRRAPFECGIVELPLRRGDLPDQLGKIAPVFVVAGAAALGRKIDTDTTIAARRPAAAASCWPPGCRSDSR